MSRNRICADSFSIKYKQQAVCVFASLRLIDMSGHAFSVHQQFWCLFETEGKPPVGSGGHTSDVVGGNRVFIFGGWNGETAMNDLHVLDTDKMEWSQVTLAGTPSERYSVRDLKRFENKTCVSEKVAGVYA